MSFSALYFPTTTITPESAGQLLLVFEELFLYQPAENMVLPEDPLTGQKLLQSYAPVPLGSELDRFMRLLKDMQAHAAEYYQAYLSTISQGEEESAEAGWRQMARRLRQLEPDREPGQAELWRARLYLALAGIQAAHEQEISRGLAMAGSKEAALFKELQGDSEEIEEFELPDLGSTLLAPSPGRSEHLLEAWGLLYLADANPNRPWLLATADGESAGLLLDEYERATGRSPEGLLTIALPPTSSTAEEFTGKLRNLRSAGHESLASLGDLLSKAAFGETVSGQSPAEMAAEWQQIAARHMGAGAGQQTSALTFYRLSNMSLPGLFRLFCRSERKAEGQSSPHGILAVLNGI